MAERSKIEWTDATWNPVMGCTPVSEGCQHCYALRMIRRYVGYPGWPKVPNEVRFFPERLDEPLRSRRPRRIFVCSIADLFHPDVPFEFITEVFDTMCAWRWPSKAAERTGDESLLEDPGHTFLVLTKRPERIQPWLDWVGDFWPGDRPLSVNLVHFGHFGPHIWLGVTAENQARADERIPVLLRVPAAVRWVSIEPMLEAVDLTGVLGDQKLNWCVVGGETGPGARPMHPGWVRSVRDQCIAAGVPFFFKSWGEWTAEYPGGNLAHTAEAIFEGQHFWRVGKARAGHLLDGQEWRQYPGMLPRSGGGLEE